MIDWLSSMQQSFEYYTVDPSTWKDVKRIENVLSCTIDRDSEVATLGSANISLAETIGESYIRVYLVVNQNGNTYKEPLGTFLVQTPTWKFNGKTRDISIDAYTPLLELKENLPPIGYSLLKDENIMNAAYRLCRERVRAPVVEAACSMTLHDDFVANTDDTWLTFLTDLVANAKYTFGLDELGRVIFLPIQDAASLQPVWTYTDDNSSILYPSISMDHDLYGVPNVVEVIYSTSGENYYAKVVNDDPNSPASTVRRGREIIFRETDPSVIGDPTNEQIKNYATKLLKEASSITYTVSYTHAYCPVRVGDCVMLNYERAGIRNVKAKVISQNIKCEPGTPVTEKAIFTAKLWR